jgi:hypothetical protein
MIVSPGFPLEFTQLETRRSLLHEPRARHVTVLGPGLKSFQSTCLSFFSGSCRQPYSFVGPEKSRWLSKSRRKAALSGSFQQVTVQRNSSPLKLNIGMHIAPIR